MKVSESVERLRSRVEDCDFDPLADTDDLATLIASHEALRLAAGVMLHAVCSDTGFAAAVREHSGLAYPWAPLDQAEEALSRAHQEASQ